jgi:tetratricopeptide (TPR) repeat protein
MLGDLYINIGGQQQSIGELQKAESSFQNALNIYMNLQAQSPNDFKIRGAIAKTFWSFAQLKTTENNFDEGLENYQKAVEIYQQLAIDDESFKMGYLRNLALTNKYMGSIWQQRGEPEKALQYFQKSLEIDLENAKNSPNDVSAQLDLSFTYGSVASASRDLKNFPAALENYQNAVEIRASVFNADSKNVFAENALARGYQELGRTFLLQNKYAQAEEKIAKSQPIYQKMADADGENIVNKLRLADNSGLLGYINGLSLKLNRANEFFSKSLAIYAELLKQEKLSTINQRRLASTYIDYGEVLLKNKQTTKALENLNKAQELFADEKVRKDAKEELEKLEKLLIEVKRK